MIVTSFVCFDHNCELSFVLLQAQEQFIEGGQDFVFTCLYVTLLQLFLWLCLF